MAPIPGLRVLPRPARGLEAVERGTNMLPPLTEDEGGGARDGPDVVSSEMTRLTSWNTIGSALNISLPASWTPQQVNFTLQIHKTAPYRCIL